MTSSQTSPAVRAIGLTKTFGEGPSTVRALDGVDAVFERAQLTAIMGPSGSGKSTLLHCVAGLDTPTSGQVWIANTEISDLSDDELTVLRRDRLGFIFQAFNLLPTLTAHENIVLPVELAGRDPDPQRVTRIVERMGLADRLTHRPNQLSGGQQQRVACARALVTAPEVIFADEPTGALDSTSSGEVLSLLRHSVDELGQTVVMVTHEPAAAAYADTVLFLNDGRVVDTMRGPSAKRVLDRIKHLDEVA